MLQHLAWPNPSASSPPSPPSQPDPDRRIPAYHDVELVQELSRMMRTAQKASSRAPRVADESKKWLEWPEYLGLVRSLKAECAGEVARHKRGRRGVADESKKWLDWQ